MIRPLPASVSPSGNIASAVGIHSKAPIAIL